MALLENQKKMKTIIKLLIIGFTLFNIPIFSQDTIPVSGYDYKFALGGGVGVPEFINLNLKYGSRNLKAGFGVGFFPVYVKMDLDFSIYYHFARKSRFNNNFLWYARGGVDLLKPNSVIKNQYKVRETEYILLIRLGRTFEFSKRSGLNLDIGIVFYDDFSLAANFPIGSIGYFYRLRSPF